jgi:hypothetical protein
MKKIKYNAGGLLTNINPVSKKKFSEKTGAINNDVFFGAATGLSNVIDSSNTDENGMQDELGAGMSGALRYGAMGAKFGSALGPMGGLIGGGIGALAGGIYSTSTANKQNAQQYKINSEIDRMRQQEELRSGNAKLNAYDTKGINTYSLYARGGILPLKGKTQLPVLMQGPKHEEGGIDMPQYNAEVEGGEVIYGNKVFSDRLTIPNTNTTFADMAASIAKTKEFVKEEKVRNISISTLDNVSSNIYNKGTATRNIQKYPNPLENLFGLQEQIKQAQEMQNKETVRQQIQLNQEETIETVPADETTEYAYGGTLGDPTDLYYLGIGGRPNTANRIGDKNYIKPKPTVEDMLLQLGNNYIKPNMNLLNNSRAIQLNNAINTPDITEDTDSQNKYLSLLNQGKNKLTQVGKFVGNKVLTGINNIDGNDIAKGINNISPYLDNIVNAAITANTPKIPAPTLNTAANLNTQVNLNADVSNLNRQALAARQAMLMSGLPSQTIGNNLTALNIQNAGVYGQLNQQKINSETQLRNQQAQLNAENKNTNNRLIDDYNNKVMMRKDDIHARISANTENIVDDIQTGKLEKNQMILDNQNLALVAAKYASTGVLTRSDYSLIMSEIASGKSPQEVMQMIENKKIRKNSKGDVSPLE